MPLPGGGNADPPMVVGIQMVGILIPSVMPMGVVGMLIDGSKHSLDYFRLY